MPRDGSGTYTFPANSFNPAVTGTEIDADDFNEASVDVETAISASIAKDGQTVTTAAIPFAAGINVNNTGLKVYDTDASHLLSIVPGSNLTAARTFTLTTGDAARTLDMSAGSLTAGGGQYVFPASQNASADANTLDDYEEGTFTPGIAFGGGTTGITYTAQVGRYVKVGRSVKITNLYMELSSNGSSTGNVTITGLPFAAANNTNAYTNFPLYGSLLATITGQLQGYLAPAGTTVLLSYLGTGTITVLTEANVPDTAVLLMCGVYEA